MLAAPTGRVDGGAAPGVRCPPRAARVAGEMVRGFADDCVDRLLIRRVRRGALVTAALVAVVAGMSAGALRGGADGPGNPPGPSSQGTGALTHGKLVAGAGGTYLPIIPAGIAPGGSDPRNPLQIPPPGPNPQGMTCPNAH